MARIRNLPYYAYLRYCIHRLQAHIDASSRITTYLSTQRGIEEYAYRITLNNTQFNASGDFETWARRDEKLRRGLGGLEARAVVLGRAEEALLVRMEVMYVEYCGEHDMQHQEPFGQTLPGKCRACEDNPIWALR